MIETLTYNPIQVNSYDPTRTTVLRNAFARDMRKWFRELTHVIWQAIVEEDCFGLKAGFYQMTSPGRQAFVFPRSADKVSAFMEWMNRQVEAGILEVREFQQIGTGVEGAWTNKYIQDSYKRGVIRARYELKKAGFDVPTIEQTGGIEISMSTPFHIDRVGLLYSRTFAGLKGITTAMDTQISRVLAQGMADGDNPRLLARKLIATINGTGMGELAITDTLGRFIPTARRAEMLARTEIIRAHHNATIQEYRNWAVEGVKVKAEFVTAGDDRVCDRCAALERSIWTLDQIEGMIPVHVQCRCIALPFKGTREKTDEIWKEGTPSPSTTYMKNWENDHEQYLKWLAEDAGIPIEKLKLQINQALKKEFSNASVVVRVPSEKILPQILKDGRIKSQFETGTSRGVLNNSIRAKFEKNLFNYSESLDSSSRPIYGMVTEDIRATAGSQYGDVIIQLKSSVKKRTTWTMGDSLDLTNRGQNATLIGTPVSAPTEASLAMNKFNYIDDLFAHTKIQPYGGFTEAQIHGGVNISDIRMIYFRKPPSTSIQKTLHELNISWDMIPRRGR